MLAGFARNLKSLSILQTGLRIGFVALLLLVGVRSVHDASAIGDTRTLSFHHTHSGEDITVTFKRNGRYDEEALKKLDHHLRDWRSQDQTTMDRRLFDILWEVYRDVGAKEPINIISAYRAPATNAMLRRRSSGVARFSQHMQGQAIDFFIPGVPLEQIRVAGLRMQRGGVGFYPTSGSPFVHLDVGNIRHWPRMSHDQLARVFPNGRTVHVPSDGNPMPGYELALADLQRRGNESGGSLLTRKPGNLLASLFGGKTNEDDEEAAATSAPVRPVAVAAVKSELVPIPRAKPAAAATYQVAAAATQTVTPGKPSPARPVASKPEQFPQTPADIINARGFWGDEPTKPKQATPAQIAALSARNAFASADPQSTASLPPASQTLAYAPSTSSVDRAPIVAASAPMLRSARPASAARNPMMSSPELTTIVGKGQQGRPSVIATSARLAVATNLNDVWMRAMILAPSASTSMSASVMGEPDMKAMRTLFVKPNASIAMSFADDPQMGLTCERFTGSAIATLATRSFVVRTAALR